MHYYWSDWNNEGDRMILNSFDWCTYLDVERQTVEREASKAKVIFHACFYHIRWKPWSQSQFLRVTVLTLTLSSKNTPNYELCYESETTQKSVFCAYAHLNLAPDLSLVEMSWSSNIPPLLSIWSRSLPSVQNCLLDGLSRLRLSLRSAGAERRRLPVVLRLGALSVRVSLSAAPGSQSRRGSERLSSERAAGSAVQWHALRSPAVPSYPSSVDFTGTLFWEYFNIVLSKRTYLKG